MALSGGRGPSCPACLSQRLHLWFEKVMPAGPYRVYRCKACGSAFVLPRPGDAELEQFYRTKSYGPNGGHRPEDRVTAITEREARYPNTTLDAVRMVSQCAELASGRRFLDVGAGFGFFTREAVRQGFAATALEPSAPCRELFAVLNGFEPAPSLLTGAFADAYRGAFDVVLMSQVLEHLPDLDAVLGWLKDLLSPQGVAAIAVPRFRSVVSILQGRDDMFVIPPEHLNFLTLRGLNTLFERQGFRCLRTETISRFDPSRLRPRVPAAANALAAALRGGLSVADRLGRGMYINAYFQKGAA
jgi:SAM-dependent methyltransferase